MSEKPRDIGQLSADEIKAYAGRCRCSKTRKARLGVIGAGWWATTNHIPLLFARSDVELVSVCGLDVKLLRRCRRDFGFQHITTDYRELLGRELDGVVIASPHPLHAEHALAALKANCHLMVEKPFATSAQKAREIVALADRKKRHIVVPYGWHYRPLALKAKEMMSRNPLGKIEFTLCHMASPIKNLLSGKSFDHADGAYVSPNLSTWADPAGSHGGFGQGQLSHAMGLLFWLTGLRGQSVYCKMTAAGARVDLYDSMSVRFADGSIGAISGAATLPPGVPGAFQLDLRIFGAKGMLHIDIARDHLSLHTHKGEHRVVPLRPGDGAYLCDGPPHQFVELILGLTGANHSPGEIAMRTVEILDAAYRSNRSGREEKI